MSSNKELIDHISKLTVVVEKLTNQLDRVALGKGPITRSEIKPVLSNFLKKRKEVLKVLGIDTAVPRWAWSHDNGDAIIFDAWDDTWERDSGGNLKSYPLRTNDAYNLADSRDKPRLGHTRWQHHVDVVVSGQRDVIAIMPVREDTDPNTRTKGWLPQYVTGSVDSDDQGQIRFLPSEIVPV